jgi:hypothetical protein
MDFFHKKNYNDIMNVGIAALEGINLSAEETDRLNRIRRFWNFYDGFHWEEIEPQDDKPEITTNFCRIFVNKFVAAELGDAFVFKTSDAMNDVTVDVEGKTLFSFLTDVWKDNNQGRVCIELGQMKSITGDSWVQIHYFKPDELDDPFGEYERGRIAITVLHSSVVFPTYDPHDKNKLVQLVIQYPIEVIEKSLVLKTDTVKRKLYKQVWTKDKVTIFEGKEQKETIVNTYGVIPFVQIKNFPVVGRTEGTSDLEDVVPLNTEFNMKNSDVSEIIDYHSAPVTIVYGAKIGSLEKGANKIWGGLPTTAKVENLELKGDLAASVHHISATKEAMCEVAGVPEQSIGGELNISNTSGVALQYLNLPLIERLKVKKLETKEGLQKINKLIVLIAFKEGLITKPESVSAKDFYYNEVTIPDTMPKDMLMELQAIQQEMSLGLEDRRGAMKRLHKEDIEQKIKDVDEDKQNNPEFYGQKPSASINSGVTNGQTPVEQVRKELTGKNG